VSGLAALAAAFAVWLWLGPAGAARLAGGPPAGTRSPWRWLRWAPTVGAGLVGAVWGGWAVGVSCALVTFTAARLLRARRRSRDLLRAEAEVARTCQGLAGLLRLGLVPSEALAGAARDSPALAEAVAAQRVGGSVPGALRAAAEDGSGLAELAAAWEVAEASGASLSHTLEATAERLSARQDLRATVEAELAAPRATGRLLALLPLAGLGLGLLLGGDPVAFLGGSPFGQVCLVVGVALACLGLLWTELLARRHGGTGGP
jgi:tight adherence protein B